MIFAQFENLAVQKNPPLEGLSPEFSGFFSNWYARYISTFKDFMTVNEPILRHSITLLLLLLIPSLPSVKI